MPIRKNIFGCVLVISASVVLPSCTMVPEGALIACQNGIASWAGQYDPKRIDTVSGGMGERRPNGDLVTPLHVRIVYKQDKSFETRQAKVECTVNEDGAVVAVMDPPAGR